MTKKKSSEILGVKMDIFSGKNRHFRNFGPRKFFPSPPQTRRQVSAAALSLSSSLYLSPCSTSPSPSQSLTHSLTHSLTLSLTLSLSLSQTRCLRVYL